RLTTPVGFLTGNGDRESLALRSGEPSTLPEPIQEVVRWSGNQLRPEQAALVASWPKTVRVTVPGLGDVLFCHATPRNDTEIFTKRTPEERLLPIFGSLDVPLVVCGHTHMQSDRRVGKTRVVQAGSVGMPFGPRGADWLLLTPEIELRHTNYDFE